MKIISANLNGIRSAQNKGFFEWLSQVDADIICLQEIKADMSVIPLELLNFAGYHCEFHPAEKKGYSGVAIMAKTKPDNVIIGLNNPEIDSEGRYLEFQYGNLSIISLYLPSGSSGEDKQQKKFRFLDYYLPILKQNAPQRDYIICGDWNIAHQEIDLKNWKGNLKNSGFLPEERAWLTELFQHGYLDSWRTLYPEEPGYTWWSNRGQAYAKDVGWRIDYHIISNSLKDKLLGAQIYKEQKFSDHAPLIMEYAL
ncbi:MAG: exodeoxyribonuclease III [Burkholderiales bacterium]|jgi:exodeoxyribonuclease-3|nr:exodeoxyribonuclease III [Burkholderiales bacterium]